MEAMVKKGYLAVEQRRKGEGGNLYIAKVGEAPTARNMLQSLSRRLFGGSVAHAVQHLASAGALDPKELEELRNALNELSKKSER
jgi:predicted transcriptional regulator